MDRELMEKVFFCCLMLLLTIGKILMGCELDLKVVWSTLRRPIAPIIGFFTQFFFMPMLAYVIANLVLVDRGYNLFAIGLFVTGCSPGGGASNFWTLLLDGNTHLSITMTFLSTIASLFMMPLWMNLLGYKFLEMNSNKVVMTVPYSKIVGSLGGLVVPLLIGVAIARWKPKWGVKARKALRPFLIFVLAFVIIIGTICNLHMLSKITWPAVVAGLLLPWFGFMLGCFSAILLGQTPEDVTAIAIETGVQNTGIAIMLLKISFSGTDADISMLMPILVACFTPGPLLLGYAIHRIIKKIRKGEQKAIESTPVVKIDIKESNAEIRLLDDAQSEKSQYNQHDN